MNSLFVEFRCDCCRKGRKGIPYGGVGETICHECWWELAESAREMREHAEAYREAFGVRCGTCHPELLSDRDRAAVKALVEELERVQ